jgi:protein O-GlcNAc transferase
MADILAQKQARIRTQTGHPHKRRRLQCLLRRPGGRLHVPSPRSFQALVETVSSLARERRFAEATAAVRAACEALPRERERSLLLLIDLARAAADDVAAQAAARELGGLVATRADEAAALIANLRARNLRDEAQALMQALQPAIGALAIEAYHLGLERARERRPVDAQTCHRFALACDPQFARAALELGALLLLERSFHPAAALFEQAVRLQPSLGGAWLGLGQCRLHTGEGRAALAAFDQVEGDFAQSTQMLTWRGTATAQAGDDDGALACYAQALARDARCFDAIFGQALILDRRADYEQAALNYARAHALRTDDTWSLGNLVFCLRRMAAWQAMAAPEAELVARLESGRVAGYATQWVGLDLSAATFRHIAAHYIHAQSALRVEAAAAPGFAPHDGARVRIGYVSADFRDHATARLLVELLERHDRTRFEVFAYALLPGDGSPLARRIAAACEHVVDAAQWPATRLAARMRDDRIDILVDLNGHTRGACQGLLALRPAPVIVNYLGHPGTMGDYADYIIGDRYVTPRGSDAEFSEAIVRLPGCYQPNDRQREVGAATTRPRHGLPADALVACSFNQSWKLGPLLWNVWMQAMTRHPRLVLWLVDDNHWARANLAQAATHAGVDPARIVFAPRCPQAEHLARLALADIALDTAPCTSHTTASDALWMGVPLLTLCGRTFDARVAASLLHAVDLPELVTYDVPGYAATLDALMQAPQRLAALKADLLGRRASARLWDTEARVRALECAYARMHERARAGLPVSTIDLCD